MSKENHLRGFYLLDKNNNVTKLLELKTDGTYKLGKKEFKNNEEKIKYIDEVLDNSIGNLDLLEDCLKFLDNEKLVNDLKKGIKEIKNGRNYNP